MLVLRILSLNVQKVYELADELKRIPTHRAA
jgi:hypothetical protein